VALDDAQLYRVCELYYPLLALALVRKVYDEIRHGSVLEVAVVALLRKVYDKVGHGCYAGRISFSCLVSVFVGRAATQPEVCNLNF
jgi:hypothetical protein